MTTERAMKWAIVAMVALIVGIALTRSAEAQTIPRNAARITWTNAISNTDDSPIPATCPTGQAQCARLLNTRIEYGSCNGTAFGTRVGDITVAFPGTEALVSDLVVQTYCFCGFHRNDYQVESAASNVVTKTIAPPTPRPPLIAIDTVAYEIRPSSTGTLVATRIGLIPMGTSCSERQQIVAGVTYALVPRGAVDLVNWPANVKLQDVWARCG